MGSQNRRVLVTGGAGFIGSHVAEAYLARGAEVWIVDDLSSGRRSNVPEGAEFIEMDIGDPAIGDLFRDVRFDLVNHHAAQIDVRTSVSDPGLDARIKGAGKGQEAVLPGLREGPDAPEEGAEKDLATAVGAELTGEVFGGDDGPGHSATSCPGVGIG